MPAEVPVGLRRLVAERAAYRCEYCLLLQIDLYYEVLDVVINLATGFPTHVYHPSPERNTGLIVR